MYQKFAKVTHPELEGEGMVPIEALKRYEDLGWVASEETAMPELTPEATSDVEAETDEEPES